MKKYFNQFLIISIVFWVTAPVVNLFITSFVSSAAEEVDFNSFFLWENILTPIAFGLIFTTVFNLVLKRY